MYVRYQFLPGIYQRTRIVLIYLFIYLAMLDRVINCNMLFEASRTTIDLTLYQMQCTSIVIIKIIAIITIMIVMITIIIIGVIVIVSLFVNDHFAAITYLVLCASLDSCHGESGDAMRG